ncbi:MAG TPA: AIR synthase-related protein, partial [Trueperaceae bacterium]|nr:AIR synthase-related protein [Trueperaceae bacterium]
VMLSESQERMVLTATPGKEAELIALFERWGLDVAEIGSVAEHGLLRIIERGEVLGELPVAALNEPPTYVRTGVEAAAIRAARLREIGELPEPGDLGRVLLELLAAPAIADKRAVYQQYDHQVMTNTVVLPGRADAAVMRVKGSTLGIAATVDCNSRYVYLQPRLGAAHAVAEAARNLSCVGARPLGVTDNLNFGNPTDLSVYYQLESAVDGIRDACLALGTPVTGGNVSLYNQFRTHGADGAYAGAEAVHPTPTIGMVGVLDDVSRHATSDLKAEGEVLLLLGAGRPTLGASEYLYRVHGLEAGAPPELDLAAEAALHEAVRTLVATGSCDTAHDVSTGGLAVCLAEMAIAGAVGARVVVPLGRSRRTDRAPALAEALFGESAGRVVVAVDEDRLNAVLDLCADLGVLCQAIGDVGGDRLVVAVGPASHAGPDGAAVAVGTGATPLAPVLDLDLASLAEAYQSTFAEALG